jgi:hypothetical protein
MSVLLGAVGLVEVMVTVTFEELLITPVNPLIDAVICTVPAPTEVTSPVELTVATSADAVLQFTRSVTSSVVEG